MREISTIFEEKNRLALNLDKNFALYLSSLFYEYILQFFFFHHNIKFHFIIISVNLPPTKAKTIFVITNDVYDMTTFSREDIIAICITDNMQNMPKTQQHNIAKIPLMKMAAKNI